MGPIAGTLVHNIESVIIMIAALLLRYECWGARPVIAACGDVSASA